MPPSRNAQEYPESNLPPAAMAVALLSGVLGSAKTGKSSVFPFSEFWSAKGKGRVVCWVSEASKGVSGLSVLSEPLPQLAASRATRVSRQKAKKLRGIDCLFMGIYLSSAAGRQRVRVRLSGETG